MQPILARHYAGLHAQRNPQIGLPARRSVWAVRLLRAPPGPSITSFNAPDPSSSQRRRRPRWHMRSMPPWTSSKASHSAGTGSMISPFFCARC